MDKRRGLTRIELIVLIGAVALIILLVFVSQHRIRRRPGLGIVCMNSLKNWGFIFAMYASDNNDHFFSGEGRGDGSWWIEPTRHLWQTRPEILLCPMATKPLTKGGRSPFAAWTVDGVPGSYGINGWICDPARGKTELRGQGPIENYWRTTDVNEAENTPVFCDVTHPDAWPRETDTPADAPGDKNAEGMQRVCCNRHEGFTHVLFMDSSVRRVGQKELWKLKWHRTYNTDGPWTLAGGVQPMAWPEWMRRFRDY
jgi:hypothetical protein